MNARHDTDLAALANAAALARPGLEAQAVAVRVPGKTLLEATSVQFRAGEVTAILGPNGAGKSTLMSVLTGQRQPDSGAVELGGRPLRDCAPADLARLRAFVAQETQVAFDFSVREVVDLGRYPHRRRPSPQEAGIADLAMHATAVDHLAGRALNTLSGGEKARVHLARALAQVWESPADGAARWLLLDEPTAALDLKHQHRMLELARHWASEQGVGVVAVLHDLNLALRYSDRCIVLRGGAVAASGSTAAVLTPAFIAEIWQVAAHRVELPSGARQYVFDTA